MSLKQEIETWVAAMALYDNNEFEESLKTFESISDTSKILFNCGVIHATLGEHERAVECYSRAVGLDMYLAVAYFQQGVSNFLMGDFEEALANFNDTLLYLRGNNNIDYEQLGLKFKLYSCEVLFNRGLCYIYLQQKEAGLQDLQFASKEKVVADHDVIDEAIGEQAEGYTVFSIPVGIVYRPNEAKVKNLAAKDYLGKARLVAASDRANAFTGFTGAEIQRQNLDFGSNAKDDRPEEALSYAATNLVKPNLSSRRQQSEPPIQRNMFPPTPPPESEKGSSTSSTGPSRAPASSDPMSRAASVKNGHPPKPRALDLGIAAFDQSGANNAKKDAPRPAPARSMSETPRPIVREYTPSRRKDSHPPRRMIEEDDDEDAYPSQLYDMYQQRRPSHSSRQRSRSRQASRRPTYVEDVEEEDESDYDQSDDAEFEMVRPRPSVRARGKAPSVSLSSSSGGGSRRGGVQKVRVKVHAEDTRYVLLDTNRTFQAFATQVRDKFGLRGNFKIMIRDDGDMITMSDQDDLDMAVRASRQEAKMDGSDMGRMEVWIQEL